jgi:uncharacterized membrane protein YdjX (TVP38/TMEM64 family)
MSRGVAGAVALVLTLGLALAWAFTPLRDALAPRDLLASAAELRATGWGMLLVPPVFVLLSLAMVPTTILRWATVVAFDPLFGVVFMVLGVLGATFVGHAIGERLGAERMSRFGGDRVERIRARLGRTGVLGIAALRQVPLGPFMIVNAAAGALRVRRGAFLGGTLVGMVPGAIVMVLAGGSLRAWLLG